MTMVRFLLGISQARMSGYRWENRSFRSARGMAGYLSGFVAHFFFFF
jgi:hypothetical protein